MVDATTGSGALVEIGMPRLSDSMEEATILTWLKRPGDRLAKGEPLVEVETDKATVVYESELDGVLEEVVVAEGEAAELGAVIARVRADTPPQVAAGRARDELSCVPARVPSLARTSGAPPSRSGATPVARRRARELGVELDGIVGTGPGGRIVASDVEAAAEEIEAGDEGGRGAATEVRLTPTQRTIATRMAESRSSIPEFTLEVEIAMDVASALRSELREAGRTPLPSLNDLVVRAVALALRDLPQLNASYEPGRVVRHGRINVGVAVDTGEALIVPTIRDADRKSLFEVAEESRRLAEAAQAHRLAPEDLADGTFTVSNLGMFGVRRFHAVIYPPQVAILAVGAVAPRAVVDADGRVVARQSMDVALSCDHRVVYGAEAARFLERVRELLEQPGSLVGGEEGR